MTNRQFKFLAKVVLSRVKPSYSEGDISLVTTALKLTYFIARPFPKLEIDTLTSQEKKETTKK